MTDAELKAWRAHQRAATLRYLDACMVTSRRLRPDWDGPARATLVDLQAWRGALRAGAR